MASTGRPEGKRDPLDSVDIAVLRQYIEILANELNQIYRSRSWKLVLAIRRIARPGRVRWLADQLRKAALRQTSRSRRARFRSVFSRWDEPPGVDLGHQIGVQWIHQRSGWTYAVDVLSVLDRRHAPYLDTCVERTFARQAAPLPTHAERWVGICHVPPCIPEWLPESLRHQFFLHYSRTPAWYCAHRSCAGLFALSEVHARDLHQQTGLPVCTLRHPTEIPSLQWSLDRFVANRRKRILQIGWWLRKIHAIFQARFPGYEKIYLELTGQRHVREYFEREEEYLLRRGEFRGEMGDSATIVPYVRNRVYDRLLSENLVFLDLYGSSANNAIVECMARGTPILVNPLPAVVEYLGPDYPLYYSSYEEAAAKASDIDLVHKAHEHLASPEIRSRITAESFLASFVRSSIYQSLARG